MQSKTRMPISVYLLATCQALMMSSTSLLMTISALVGLSLADDKSLSTLPLSFQFLGLMLTSIPASLFMGKYGRKAGFTLASIIGFCFCGFGTLVYFKPSVLVVCSSFFRDWHFQWFWFLLPFYSD